MKRIFKYLISFAAGLLVSVQMGLFTSCSDDIPADSYYTFTGQTIADYISNNSDFSMYRRIVERAGYLPFFAARGEYTCFPATNAGVQRFLNEKGYASVEDIPQEYCDTIVKVHLIENIRHFTSELTEETQWTNSLELPLIVRTGEKRDANGLALSVINNTTDIINELKNDTVENGVVHPVNNIIVPNTSVGKELFDKNHGPYSIYYEALRRSGLLDSLVYYLDDDYEQWKEKYPEFKTKIYSGGAFSEADKGYEYTAKRPDHLKSGFTVYVVPDDVLIEKYASYGFRAGEENLDANVQALYDLALEKYSDEESKRIFGTDESHFGIDKIEDRKNPLNMFLSYHIVDRLFTSRDIMLNPWGVNTNKANPAEWVSTLLDHSLLKIEKVYVRSTEADVDHPRELYLNHCTASDYSGGERVRGAWISDATGVTDYFSVNSAFYYIDEVIAYDQNTRSKVMNTRMRYDFVTLFPELTNNNMRLHGNYRTQPYYTAEDNTETGRNGFNFYIPNGYLKNVTMNEDAIFFVQRPKLTWWNMGGDEINFLGSSYDISFRLPAVPPGNYEVRIGYAGMFDRGIAQVYVDNVPQGIPIDMRFQADDSRVGGIYDLGTEFYTSTEYAEAYQENNRAMKNNGYYRGPASVFTPNSTWCSKNETPVYGDGCNDMNQNKYTYRRKICDVQVLPNQHHVLRIRSVYTQGNRGCLMLDYMEMIPLSICGAGGLGEDDN